MGIIPLQGMYYIYLFQPRSCFFQGGAPIYLWYKGTNIIPDDHSFIQVIAKFPHYFYVYIIYPLNAMSNYGFCRTQGAEICTLTQAFFFDDILGAWWGIALLGNTEVVPWDLGKTKWRCQGAEICMWTQETALILYSTMIFPAMDSGSFILRFRQKKCRSFGSGDTKSIATANPSHNNTLFYILSKYSIKKSISELRSNW